jgi:phage gpG-like protein
MFEPRRANDVDGGSKSSVYEDTITNGSKTRSDKIADWDQNQARLKAEIEFDAAEFRKIRADFAQRDAADQQAARDGTVYAAGRQDEQRSLDEQLRQQVQQQVNEQAQPEYQTLRAAEDSQYSLSNNRAATEPTTEEEEQFLLEDARNQEIDRQLQDADRRVRNSNQSSFVQQ